MQLPAWHCAVRTAAVPAARPKRALCAPNACTRARDVHPAETRADAYALINNRHAWRAGLASGPAPRLSKTSVKRPRGAAADRAPRGAR